MMKITLKRLGIFTVIAFLLSPLISPIPGILLAISMGFYWLSLQLNSSHDVDEEEEEEKDETEVIDRGDHVVIFEKKMIKKADLTYEDFRKYNLKNINCVKDCVSFEAPKSKNHYSLDHKKCSVCDKWLIYNEGKNCPCCSAKLKTKDIKEQDVK